ncbi:Multidrug resistance-associated protein 1 [Geranomyces variabilis]|nr:Multidrug resistance-associated protein 1 [Geranomyces variabilis]
MEATAGFSQRQYLAPVVPALDGIPQLLYPPLSSPLLMVDLMQLQTMSTLSSSKLSELMELTGLFLFHNRERYPCEQVERITLDYFRMAQTANPLLKQGHKAPLDEENIPPCPADESHAASAHALDAFWRDCHTYWSQLTLDDVAAAAAGGPRPPSLARALEHHFRTYSVVGTILQLVNAVTTIILPVLIPQVLALLIPGSSTRVYAGNIYGLAIVFFLFQILSALTAYAYQSLTISLSIKVNTILSSAVYQKSLRLSSKAQKIHHAGKINTLISADVAAVASFPTYLLNLAGLVVQLVLAILMLFIYLRLTALPAMALYAVLVTFEIKIMPRIGKGIKGYSKGADSRSKVLREWLYAVRFVKFEAIEDKFRAQINVFRSAQLAANKGVLTVFALFFSSGSFREYMIPPLTFLVYATFHEMDPGTLFASLALLDAIAAPSGKMNSTIEYILRVPVPYQRINQFLTAEEVHADEVPSGVMMSTPGDGVAIRLDSARFTWELTNNDENSAAVVAQGPFHIDITLDIPKGALVAIVGAVGSGKSSLMSALVGGMRKTRGEAFVRGSIAYCPQDPWLLSASVEDNIVFEDERARARVPVAIEAACLEHDLDLFPHGAATLIGEKGITLSGGQKSRVALARAIASDASIYILDDPTSALDAHVSRHVIEKTICTLLRKKTVVVATNALHILPRTDLVVVLTDGKVAEVGDFKQLISNTDGALSQLMANYTYDDHDGSASAGDEDEVIVKAVKSFETQQAIKEDRKAGGTEWATIFAYFNSGGPLFLPGLVMLTLLLIAVSSLARIFLELWAQNSFNLSTGAYIRVYAGISAINTALLAATVTFSFLYATIACKRIHDRAMDGVETATMPFFESTPAGQVLNRLGVDCREVDTDLLIYVYFTARESSGFLTAIVVVAYSAPFILVTLAAAYFYRVFKPSYRELKRLTSVCRSPVLSLASETIHGAASIKAYGVSNRFIEKQHKLIDCSSAVSLFFQCAKTWLGLRLDLLTSTIVLGLIVLGAARVVDGVAVGLGLTGAITLGRRFQTFLVTLTSTSAMFNSVERLDYYRCLPSEPPQTLPSDPEAGTWPVHGEIVAKDLVLCYAGRKDRSVIDGVSFRVAPGEKIAICGRTGSGKSSLAAAFFRMLEITGGSLCIDDHDIRKMGLKSLRSSLCIVPQDATIFEGTVRSNLDLRGTCADKDLWTALAAVGLDKHISTLLKKLDAPLAEGGKNLSAGQKQLLALARAILRQPRVLILDEATSNLDIVGAARAHELLQTSFEQATVLSIMHSLNHVAQFDRVMLFEDGHLVECDTPKNLLQRESKFAELLEATGAANAERVRALAKVRPGGAAPQQTL